MTYERLSRSYVVTRGTLSVATYRRVAYLSGLVYLALFLFATQDLVLDAGRRGLALTVVDDPWVALERRNTFSFEPLARLDLPGASLLVSPGNLAIGGALAALVGLNLSFTYLALRRPRACSTSNATGVLAAAPALVAGSACCAPVIFLVLGVQATAGLLALQTVLLPASAVALVVSLVYVAGKVDVTALA